MNDLLDRVLAEDAPDRGDAFDRLAAEGARAIPAIADAIATGRAWLVGADLLAAIAVPRRARALAPLLQHGDRQVQSAAILALGLSRDSEAVDLLVDVLARRGHRRTAVTAIGNLGIAAALQPLRAALHEMLGDPADPAIRLALLRRAEGDLDPSDLLVVADAAAAFAKLGDGSLVGTAIELSRFHPDPSIGFDEAGQVRTAAVQALDVSVGAGVAAAVMAACADEEIGVVEAALIASLHIGRTQEADAWLALPDGPAKRTRAVRWNLQELTGQEPPEPWLELQRWWARLRKRLDAGRCIREGKPASPALQIAKLDGPDAPIARQELRYATGLTVIHTLSIPSPHERAQIDAWWSANAARFPPGKLHRWGRSYEPGAVDG